MRNLIILLLFSPFIFSCKKSGSDNQVIFKFAIPAQTSNGRNISVTKLKIYFSNFKIYDDKGKATLLKDVILVQNNGDGFSFTLPQGNYKKMIFDFGLDSTLNKSVPTTFEASHPLSLEQDMYWGMIKYRFLVIEGSIDSSAAKTSPPNTPYAMHLGTDTLWKKITFNDQLVSGSHIEITLNLNDIFKHAANIYNPVDYSNQSTVSEIPQAILISTNFVNGITVKQVQE